MYEFQYGEKGVFFWLILGKIQKLCSILESTLSFRSMMSIQGSVVVQWSDFQLTAPKVCISVLQEFVI